MALPPSFPGALHVNPIPVPDGLTAVIVGAPGTVRGVVLLDVLAGEFP